MNESKLASNKISSVAQIGLPLSEQVDVSCLAKTLKDAHASYKFLLLKIILQHSKEEASSSGLAISIKEIRREMLINSWFPVRHFQLNFGVQDKIQRALKEVVETRKLVHIEKPTRVKQIRAAFKKRSGEIDKVENVVNLTQHPIYRMLKPWFEEDIKGLKEHEAYKRIAELSNQRFNGPDKPPLYRIEQGKSIYVHKFWVEYFKANRQIINGWLDNEWLHFLTRQNPNAPTLGNKLWTMPTQRSRLKRQREYWNDYINVHEFRCPYSHKPLGVDKYELDHFLPWTWIGHDQLWNLIPADKEKNSSKGNGLPGDKHIVEVAKSHLRAIRFTKENFKDDAWRTKVEDYVRGLNVPYEELLKTPNIINIYKTTVKAQLALAKRQGFDTWKNL